jgi:hypothetical protein
MSLLDKFKQFKAGAIVSEETTIDNRQEKVLFVDGL